MSKHYNIGDTVGYWTLIEEVPKPEGRVYNGIYWNCKCKCGTEKVILEQTLVKGKSKSCGCSRKIDLIGKKIGKLTVIEPVNDNDGRSKWLCLCDCGNTKIILQDKLSGKSPTLSCGCLRFERINELMHRTNEYVFKDDYVIGIMSNGNSFTIDIDDYDKIKDYCWYENKNGYIVSHNLRLNRIIMDCNDENLIVDHQDRNPKNNRKNNLRVTTQDMNCKNTSLRLDNASGVKGVYYEKRTNKWVAEIICNTIKYRLGRFNNKLDAIKKRFLYECILYDTFSAYYKPESDEFVLNNGEIIIKLDRNKLIQPVDTEAEEISYEELKSIPSERGCGSLGSSGK